MLDLPTKQQRIARLYSQMDTIAKRIEDLHNHNMSWKGEMDSWRRLYKKVELLNKSQKQDSLHKEKIN